MSGIEVFTPKTVDITINGTEIHVGPLKARRFAAFQSAIGPVWAELKAGNLPALVGPRYEATRAALVAAADVSPEWLDEQSPDTVMDLLGHVLEVNNDFLVHRLAPATDRLVASLKRMTQAAGAPSSPASAPSDTPSPSPST